MIATALVYSGQSTRRLLVEIAAVFVVAATLGWPLTIEATLRKATRPAASVACKEIW
jgi:hypothetical protein